MKERPSPQDNLQPTKGRPEGKVNAFMYDHGRKIATISTLSRVPGGAFVARRIIADKLTIAQVTHGILSASDKLDGIAAKKSKKGPTIEGGKLDQRVDKFFSGVTELSLAVKGHLSGKHVAARGARDIIMSGIIRPYFEKRGVDTSAVRSGKVSTVAVTIADNFAMTKTARRHPIFNEAVQDTATGLKIYSAIQSSREWIKRKKQKEAE